MKAPGYHVVINENWKKTVLSDLSTINFVSVTWKRIWVNVILFTVLVS